MSDEPRQYTLEECQKMFLSICKQSAHYWATTKLDPEVTRQYYCGNETKRRVEGAIFSVLVMLDGEHGGAPAFSVCPDPHPTDAEWCKEHGENWWPDSEDAVDIAGSLHDMWGKM